MRVIYICNSKGLLLLPKHQTIKIDPTTSGFFYSTTFSKAKDDKEIFGDITDVCMALKSRKAFTQRGNLMGSKLKMN